MKDQVLIYLLNSRAALKLIAMPVLAGLLVVVFLTGLVVTHGVLPLYAAEQKGKETEETEEGAANPDKDVPEKSLLEDIEILDLIQSKSIPRPLTGKRGSPKRGEALAINRKKGNCIACHRFSVFEEKAKKDPNAYGDMGEVGPSLDGVGSRYDAGKLRLMIVDAKQFYPETIMPSFYKITELHRVAKDYDQKPILTLQEVEDIVAFLATLKQESGQ